MKSRFCNYIEQNRLFAREDTILVGVSGGIDSIVLLHLLKECGFHPTVAHCNFCLRGNESDGDENFVAQIAKEWSLPFYSIRFDTMRYAEEQNLSIQMAARKLRYEWFEQLTEIYGYSKIAIAHNNDDTIETFFINLLRGTGLKGLAGIPVNNGRIVRPLLFASRREIEKYAAEHGLTHREDSTNAQTKYLRNKIRHKIVPLFRAISPRFDTTMQENILRMGQTFELVQSLSGELWKKYVRQEHETEIFPLRVVFDYTPASYLLYEIIRRYGFDYSTTEEIMSAYVSGHNGAQFFSSSRRIVLDRGNLLITAIPSRSELSEAETLRLGEQVTFRDVNYFCIQTDVIPTFSDYHATTACFDAEKLIFPLKIRLWKPGDRFYPLGMEKSKKISDYLTDSKMALPQKERQQVVLSGNDIIWLTGLRIDNRYKITEQTQKVIKISIL